ncbi:MAG: ParB N-terminal domain-containing protein, partial [Desulfobacteraceae bacterium]|nr:ParB N-terminal domain-containing protein [Desulfobacteraceae bacterium]
MFEREEFIDINLIDLDNKIYRISSDYDISKLKESIQANGLINTCLVREKNKKFIIISGFKRIRALKELGYRKVPAKIVNETDNKNLTDLYCAKTSIIDNAFHRELDIIEQVRGVALLSAFMTNEEIAKNSSSVFNTVLNTKIVRNLLKIESMISPNKSVHDQILTKKLSIKSALEIQNYEPEILNSFLRIFQKVKMGQNKQLEVIKNFNEISKRDNISLFELLNSSKVSKIIDHENPDENYKGNLLRSFLTQERYPELTKAHEEHKKGVQKLKLEPGIKLNPPNNFEGEKYSLSF